MGRSSTEMSFSPHVKERVRKRANGCCCFCEQRSLSLEIHHIVPQAEGGPDTEDNAAPLCPNCHSDYGGNPEKRARIREMRDHWYTKCEAKFAENTESKKISDTIQNLPSKEDIERIAVRNASYVLGASEGGKSSLEHSRYSFVRKEFVHPLIVRELLGWISDSTETVTSVNIASSNESNRFYGEFKINPRDGRSWVKWTSSEGEFFVYAHIATSPSGVEMVECYDCGGGSGVFGSVGLFCLEFDRALGEDHEGKVSTHERVILKTLGSIGLGDRYKGEITYEDGFLVVGPDNGLFNRGLEVYRKLPIR